MIGYAICGSFCTHKKSIGIIRLLAEKYEILPIMSECVYTTDTRFGKAVDLCEKVENICGRKIIHTIKDAEPLGPEIILEALVVAPCTGNTLAKLANGITDTSVSMAVKAHLRADRPVLIALATNDAMSANLGNIAAMLRRKQVYFVPMKQDDPENKPHSAVADFSLIPDTLEKAVNGIQQYPLFL